MKQKATMITQDPAQSEKQRYQVVFEFDPNTSEIAIEANQIPLEILGRLGCVLNMMEDRESRKRYHENWKKR